MTKAGWIAVGASEGDPAQAVLQGLERFSAEFAELRAARAAPTRVSEETQRSRRLLSSRTSPCA
jgi:hypothetical protein